MLSPKNAEDSLMALVIFTLISAIAYRGACSIIHNTINGYGALHNPMWTTTKSGHRFVTAYMFLAIPIACLNGVLMYGFIGLIIAGVGTWIGMPVINLLFRFNPGNQFMICGTVTFIWTVINILTST